MPAVLCIKYIYFKGFILDGVKNFIDELAKILLKNSTFIELHDMATQKGCINVVFKDGDKLHADAEWDAEFRKIRISDDIDFIEMLDCLIFELCNASNDMINSKYMDLDRFQTEVEFAYAVEHCEFFHTFLPYRKAFLEILKDEKILTLLEQYDAIKPDIDHIVEQLNSIKTFSDFFEMQSENLSPQNHLSHIDGYKNDFLLWKKQKTNDHPTMEVKPRKNYLNTLSTLEKSSL